MIAGLNPAVYGVGWSDFPELTMADIETMQRAHNAEMEERNRDPDAPNHAAKVERMGPAARELNADIMRQERQRRGLEDGG